MDDQTRTLILRARRDDPAAVEELFRRYRDRLHRAIGRLLGPRYRDQIADSEDAVHDAILSALARIDTFDYDGEGSFLAWLLRSADYEIKTRIRAVSTQKRGRHAVHALDGDDQAVSPAGTPSEAAAHFEDEERVRACIRELPPREQEIILLRRYLELPMDEILDELGLLTAGAGRALLSRAQARLAGLLAKES